MVQEIHLQLVLLKDNLVEQQPQLDPPLIHKEQEVLVEEQEVLVDVHLQEEQEKVV